MTDLIFIIRHIVILSIPDDDRFALFVDVILQSFASTFPYLQLVGLHRSSDHEIATWLFCGVDLN